MGISFLGGGGDCGGEELEDFLGFRPINCVCVCVCVHSGSASVLNLYPHFFIPFALPQILHVLPTIPSYPSHFYFLNFISYGFGQMFSVFVSLCSDVFVSQIAFVLVWCQIFCQHAKCKRFIHLQYSSFFSEKVPKSLFWK
jgi:hypothetical protein